MAKDRNKATWMKKYEALTGVGGKKPQDFWDTANYLFSQRLSPEDAAAKFKKKASLPFAPDPLALKVAKLALGYPRGSEPRRKLMATLSNHVQARKLVASIGSYETDSGKKFKVRTMDFLKWLEGFGIRPGPDLAGYLRGQKRIPDAWVSKPSVIRGQHGEPDRTVTLKDLGATGAAVRGPRPPRARRVDVDKLWKRLLATMQKEVKSHGASAGDMFANMPSNYAEDDFSTYLAHVSGDIQQVWEDDLGPRGQALWDKLALALQTGLYNGGDWGNWDLRHRSEMLGEIYSNYWYDALSKGWDKVDSAERARLRALRN